MTTAVVSLRGVTEKIRYERGILCDRKRVGESGQLSPWFSIYCSSLSTNSNMRRNIHTYLRIALLYGVIIMKNLFFSQSRNAFMDIFCKNILSLDSHFLFFFFKKWNFFYTLYWKHMSSILNFYCCSIPYIFVQFFWQSFYYFNLLDIFAWKEKIC